MRAWALQERLLSSRTLHFSRGQLFWECNEKLPVKAFHITCLMTLSLDWSCEERVLVRILESNREEI